MLFVFSLNLFGMFEFITPGGTSLAGLKLTGKSGDFFNGVLATILATPCSAPFLGTALAFAFTQGAVLIMLIFLFIGIGLASPFILTAIVPSLVSVLPRPGNWMNLLKHVLGVTLIGTIIWLLDIYVVLTSTSAIKTAID